MNGRLWTLDTKVPLPQVRSPSLTGFLAMATGATKDSTFFTNRKFQSHIPKLPANPRSSMRKSVLSQHLANDHLTFGRKS